MEQMEQIEELKDKVRVLKANREKVPKEQLETKYKKPYQELLDSIVDMMRKIALERALKDIIVLQDDGEQVTKNIQAAIDEQAKEISRSVFKRYDVAEFEERVESLRIKVWNLWIPYWQEHCGLYVLPENWEENGGTPRIYNDLTKEFLVDGEKNLWEKRPEWENENRCFITAGACHILAEGLRNKK